MIDPRRHFTLVVTFLLFLSGETEQALARNGQPNPTPTPASNPPPAPSLIAPTNGASLVQPITLNWSAVSDPDGPIGSYTWQVAPTSAFTTIIASGFTNMDSDPSVPTPTADKISGLANGIYFWRVKATQLVGGATGSVDSAWSAVRSFTVTGLGPAPATPSFITPANNAQFHVRESFTIQWSGVPNAQSYILEADDEPTFSFPINLTLSPINFGTQSGGLWGNPLTIYYRVRAVSVDGVRSLPSSTLKVQITNAAPVPAGVSPIAPANGATVQLPFFLDWSDTPNPQVPGYDLEFNSTSSFALASNVLLLSPTRSDYMITRDLLAPGNYFWRVRALHGDVVGPWSAGRAITVTAPIAPPNVNLFAILAEPVNAYGGNTAHARVMLDNPAPAGGAIVSLSTDIPQVNLPATSVTVPAGRTDATIANIATGPVPNGGVSVGIIGDLFAGFANGRGQNSFGVLPILYGSSLGTESVVGGTSVKATVTLQSPAPSGGTTVRLVSSDPNIVRLPATVFIPAGATDIDFAIPTSAVSVPTRVTIETGSDVDGYRAPQNTIVVTPPGSPTPPASLSSLTLSQPSVLSGGTVTGTLRLTSSAPTGGAVVTLQGSMEGDVIVPQSVTIPAGSISANFTTSAGPETPFPRWVFIQGHYGTSGGSQARILEIDPAPGPATLLAIGPASQDVIGGKSGRASVALVIPAPAGGGTVSLTTDNPSVIHVPASVSIAAGNSAVSFSIATSPVSGLATGGFVFASAGGVTKSIFVNVTPDPNAPPLLQSMSITPTSVTGGTNATGTVFLSAPAPAGGISVTLSTSNASAARAPGIVTVPGGQTSANYTITTFAVATNTTATITAFYDTTTSAQLAVTRGATSTPTPTATPTATPPPPPPTPTPTAPATLPAPSLVSPTADARFAPGVNITFDWSNVTGAASYTIQIDDSDTFSSPFIVNQTVTASQFSSSTLPIKTMWWRARANDASGKPGNWSPIRRFEVKS
jgi:hypothetical protein